MENTPCFNCQEHINLQILKFNFQGSQKLHIRVTKSPNGLGKSILKTRYFLPPTTKTYVGPIGFYSYNFLTYWSLWHYVPYLQWGFGILVAKMEAHFSSGNFDTLYLVYAPSSSP